MAIEAWSASTSTALAAGTLRRPTTAKQNDSGLIYKVVTAGTTGSTEPLWPVTIGLTIQDGNVTWLAISAVAGELSKFAPDAIIELFEVKLDAALHGNQSTMIYRFHAGMNEDLTGNIIWQGNYYLRYPVQATGFAFQKGQLPRPQITISNTLSLMSSVMQEVNKEVAFGSDLTGAKVTRIRTFMQYLDAATWKNNIPNTAISGTFSSTGTQVQVSITGTNPGFSKGDFIVFDGTSGTDLLDGKHELYSVSQSGNTYYLFFNVSTGGSQSQESCTVKLANPYGDPSPIEFPREIYYIDRKTLENRDLVTFELASVIDLAGVRVPKRQCTRILFPSIGTFL
jgi:phage-related protein